MVYEHEKESSTLGIRIRWIMRVRIFIFYSKGPFSELEYRGGGVAGLALEQFQATKILYLTRALFTKLDISKLFCINILQGREGGGF